MRIQSVKQNHNSKFNNKAPEQNFKGAGDQFLRYLATNQAVGANGVDFAFMVLPRTTTDMVSRGPAAGMETARREASGTVNHTLIGAYGLGAGLVASQLLGIDKKFGTKTNNIFAAPETLNILAENKANQLKNSKSQIDYLKETLSNLKGFNPSAKSADEQGFVKLSEETVDEIAKILDNVISDEKLNFKDWQNKQTSNSIDVVINKITEKTGAQSKYILESSDKKISSNTELKTFLEDLFKVSESFNKEEVIKSFTDQIKNDKTIKDNLFVTKLQKFMKTRSVAGFAMATAIGMSIQPINIYLTKLKTGSDGFVGVEGRCKDNSTEFKALKATSAAAFFGMVLATLKTGLGGFMSKMAFKGFWPTIPQLKGVYGLTIVSRILATRDKDELREALTKDTLGFLSWLVLGDFVNKIAAESLDKSVMNRTADIEKKSWGSRLFNSSLKSRDEILIKTLADNGISTVKTDGEKTIAKTFSEMMEDLNKISDEAIKNITKKRLKTLNKAQLAGYIFSGLVLGLGIPNLNIYITNTLDKKRKANALLNAEKQNV